ncbi:hypothetical protein [Sutcliffiella rhizosphaerae]|uniref:YhfM-like domain-containing protein n=1 Tax=Sutcliffiella rhizosphaerae TaxID=2880967 RepID=A0ABN8A5E6_9BACI|nr:hypothetical protein [Sutcliffiella rhizosphaerae]CAG9620319.1 hypothetical protein BACCIP111883_01087 [Sutcliffiella rhizosphaerae]
MRFIRVISFIGIILASLLLGCQSKQVNELRAHEITSVSISESAGFSNFNTEFFITYEDENSLAFFEQLFTHAKKEQGVADMADPEYDMEVLYSNGDRHTYYLWAGSPGNQSVLMQLKDTHTIYTTSTEQTLQLLEMLDGN